MYIYIYVTQYEISATYDSKLPGKQSGVLLPDIGDCPVAASPSGNLLRTERLDKSGDLGMHSALLQKSHLNKEPSSQGPSRNSLSHV